MPGELAMMLSDCFPVSGMPSYRVDVDVIFCEIVEMASATVSVVAWILGIWNVKVW